MAKAPVETWAFWAPLVLAIVCLLTGVILHRFAFPSLEKNLYVLSKRLHDYPLLVLITEETVAHTLIPSLSRFILFGCIYAAAVTINLAEAFGGLWIEQFILTGVIFTCFNVVYRFLDIIFVLLLKNAFSMLDVEQVNIKSFKRLYTVARGGKVEEGRGSPGGKTGGGGAPYYGDDDDDDGGGGGGCCSRGGAKKNNEPVNSAAAYAARVDNRLERGSGVESATHRQQQQQHEREQDELRQRDWMRERKMSNTTASVPIAEITGSPSLAMLPVRSKHTINNAQVLLIAKKLIKGLVAYVFLTWLLKTWNTDMTIFVAFSACAGLALAFSAREVAANFIAACLIIVYRPFEVGEWIKAEAHEAGTSIHTRVPASARLQAA